MTSTKAATPTRWGDRQARRRDILASGLQLLRENGLAALQMREVARRAGIGLGTVYTYFPTKEALFTTMYADRLDSMLAELEPALDAATDLADMFVLVATSYRDVYAVFGKELDVLAVLGAQHDLEPAVAEQLIASAGRLLAVLQSTVARTGVDEPELVLVLLWSTVTGLADHFTGPRHALHRHTWDETVRFAAHTFVRGLLHERQTR